jgi:RNA polymerase primary sigma factor
MRRFTISKDGPILERSQIFTQYMSEIKNIPMIDEGELCARISLGDSTAVHQLVSQNLKFVVSVAKQYTYSGITLMDLINEGNMGLMKAAYRFDVSKGFKFISYAVWWIRQSIMEFMSQNGNIVRLPLNKISSLHKLNRLVDEKEQEIGFGLNLNEVVVMFDLDVSDSMYSLFESSGKRALSLDMEYGTGSDSYTLGESLILSDDSFRADLDLDKQDLRLMLHGCLKFMNANERYILVKYYGLDCNKMEMVDIANDLGCTKETVKNYHRLALRKMKRIYMRLDSKKEVSDKYVPPYCPQNDFGVVRTLTAQEVQEESYKNFMENNKPYVSKFIDRQAKETPIKVEVAIIEEEEKEELVCGYTLSETKILDVMYGTGTKSTIGRVASFLKISNLDIIAAVKKFTQRNKL